MQPKSDNGLRQIQGVHMGNSTNQGRQFIDQTRAVDVLLDCQNSHGFPLKSHPFSDSLIFFSMFYGAF
jgi:hypothetical protein